MTSIRVIEPGMLTTVQDLGREGWSAFGVPIGGAADSIALRISNWLVGNPQGAPALESTLVGGAFEFESPATIALAGARPRATITTREGKQFAAPHLTSINLEQGSTLRIGPAHHGARIYLAVRGGINAQHVMNSASTHLGAAFGGHHGRVLRKGDLLTLGKDPSRAPVAPSPLLRELTDQILTQRVIRAVDSSQDSRFPDAPAFWNSTFKVSNRSDRMGMRLDGPTIPTPTEGRMPSEAMMWGAVQVPVGGLPIVLLCDHPTTGGYPVIATVATLDLPILGQLRPGDEIRFERTTPEQARELFRARELSLASMLDSDGNPAALPQGPRAT